MCVCGHIRGRLFRSIIYSGWRNGHLAVNLPLGADQVITTPAVGHRGGVTNVCSMKSSARLFWFCLRFICYFFSKSTFSLFPSFLNNTDVGKCDCAFHRCFPAASTTARFSDHARKCRSATGGRRQVFHCAASCRMFCFFICSHRPVSPAFRTGSRAYEHKSEGKKKKKKNMFVESGTVPLC